MLNTVKKLYQAFGINRIPFLRLIPNKVLFGASYADYIDNISEQNSSVITNLENAINYYRNYTNIGAKNTIQNITVSSSSVLIDIEHLPLINSSELSENLENFVSKEFSNLNSYNTTTGGTGRVPTTIRLSNESFGIEWAHIHYIWSKIGYKRTKHLKLTLRGKHVKGNRLTEFNPLYNEIVVDTFRLNKTNFHQFINEVKKYKIEYIHGYPSLIDEFIDYCISNGFNLTSIKGLMLGSEQITQKQWDNFKTFFNCKIVGWYGQSEKVILAYTTVSPNEYKILTSYGYAYIHNPDSTGFGEIVGTTFVNKAMPLVNYRTGDFGRIEKRGNELFLKDIRGRWGKDFVYKTKDKKIPTTSINIHSSIQKQILFYQIHQNTFGELEIRILPKSTNKISFKELLHEFEKSMQTNLREFNIRYRIVTENEIIRSKRGKKIMLVQDLNI